MGERRDVYRVLVEGKRLLENQDVDDKIILRWIFRKCGGEMYIGFWWREEDVWKTKVKMIR